MSDHTTTRILAIQRVVACASPSGWRDAVVLSVAEGSIELVTLTGAVETVTTDAPVVVGEPVGFHPVAEVIALGREWYSAR
jgi:hypothetical protein